MTYKKTILHSANNAFSLLFSYATVCVHIYVFREREDAKGQGQSGECCNNFIWPNQIYKSLLARGLRHPSDLSILKVIVFQKSGPSATFFPFCTLGLHFGYFLIHESNSCTMHLNMETNYDHFLAYYLNLSFVFS